MDDLSLLGNAAAVPIIIAITQFLKRNFNFKRKSEVVSLFVSLLVCFGWEFYYTPSEELISLWGSGIIPLVKHIIHLLIISGATWLSATKSYDFFVGDKKKEKQLAEHVLEKEHLKKQVAELRNDDNTLGVDDRVRALLERE